MSDAMKDNPRKTAAQIGAAVTALALALVGANAIIVRARRAADAETIAMVPPHRDLTDADRLRIGRGIEQTMGAVLRGPDLDQRLSRAVGRPVSSVADRRAAGRELSARGLSRLTAAQLDEVYAIRLELAERSTAVCAGMWSGRIADGEVMAALARLAPPRMTRWFELSMEGIRIALSPGFSTPPEDGAAIDHIVSRARDATQGADRERFLRVIDRGAEALPLEGCATLKEIYRAAAQADPALRERFFRAMARI
jgi:hypothetical protein